MQINRRNKGNNGQKTSNIIDLSNVHDDNELTYCSRCYRVNVLSKLGARILKYNEPIPSDYDLWLQCARCGLLVSVNNIKHQSTISENIEVENPNINTPHFEAITDKREKSGVGISRYKNRTTIKDKDKEIQDLIDSGVDITIHQ